MIYQFFRSIPPVSKLRHRIPPLVIISLKSICLLLAFTGVLVLVSEGASGRSVSPFGGGYFVTKVPVDAPLSPVSARSWDLSAFWKAWGGSGSFGSPLLRDDGGAFRIGSLTATTGPGGALSIFGFGVVREAGKRDRLSAFSLKANEGKFSYEVEMASTTVRARSQVAAERVPDGGSTLILLGVSLLGLQGGRRLLGTFGSRVI